MIFEWHGCIAAALFRNPLCFSKLGTTLRPHKTHHRAHFFFAHLAEILLADQRHAFGGGAFFMSSGAYGQHRLGGHFVQTVFLADLAVPPLACSSPNPARPTPAKADDWAQSPGAGFHIFGGAFFERTVLCPLSGGDKSIARAQTQPLPVHAPIFQAQAAAACSDSRPKKRRLYLHSQIACKLDIR